MWVRSSSFAPLSARPAWPVRPVRPCSLGADSGDGTTCTAWVAKAGGAAAAVTSSQEEWLDCPMAWSAMRDCVLPLGASCSLASNKGGHPWAAHKLRMA